MDLRLSLKHFRKRAFNAVLKLMSDSGQFQERMMRQQLMVLMVLARDVQSIMLWDADLLNGEQFSRSEMGFHLMLPFRKQHIHLRDMGQYARQTV
jgi:hypothetical protein